MKRIFILLSLVCIYTLAKAQVTLNIKLFIEGYYCNNGMMDNYGTGGCLYINNISPNPNDADTVTVSLMDSVNFNLIETQKAILETNGWVSVNLQGIIPGSAYYIRIQHRNTIETWSATAVQMQSVTNYDFTTAATQAYGNNMRNMGTAGQPVWVFYSGDISDVSGTGAGLCLQDGIVEAGDYLAMEAAVANILLGYNCQDLTGDGIVEAADLAIMENNVTHIVFAIHPAYNYVEEIGKGNRSSNIFKCISIGGKLSLNYQANPSLAKDYILFSIDGKYIFKKPIAEIFSNGFVVDQNLPDGCYIVKIY